MSWPHCGEGLFPGTLNPNAGCCERNVHRFLHELVEHNRGGETKHNRNDAGSNERAHQDPPGGNGPLAMAEVVVSAGIDRLSNAHAGNVKASDSIAMKIRPSAATRV